MDTILVSLNTKEKETHLTYVSLLSLLLGYIEQEVSTWIKTQVVSQSQMYSQQVELLDSTQEPQTLVVNLQLRQILTIDYSLVNLHY